MNKLDKTAVIGVFDSGVGGISVLAELIKCLPNESYIYYGDSKNAPYGTRTIEEVKELSFQVVNTLLKYRVKGLVVACNTATSGVIIDMRKALDIPIVGMEPALKPAVENRRKGKIIVMATPVTLREQKFNNLINTLPSKAEVIKLPCPGLVEIIEKGRGQSSEVIQYLEKLFSSFDTSNIASIVLGCTHYIFIKEEIAKVVGQKDLVLIDGNKGTANQLKRLLKQGELLHTTKERKYTQVMMINSNKDMIPLSKQLLEGQLQSINFKGEIEYI